jgi:hypothetical protein
MSRDWFIPLFGAALVLMTSGCSGQPEGGAPENSENTSARAPAAPASVRTAAIPSNPCDWIAADQVAALVGPLDGAPERVRSAEQPEPRDDGNACLYRLAARPRLGGNGILVEVAPTAGVIYERVAGAMKEHFAAALRDGEPAAEPPKPAAAPDAGWDYTGHLPTGFVSYTGRLGHVSVHVVSQSHDVARARLAALAARIRDGIPDLPFQLPPDPMLEELKRMDGGGPEPPPSGPDPCGLLTRAEAEAVLGTLVVAPYRSGGPLVDSYGNSCTYFTAGHHALVLTPHWDTGKMMIGMARDVGGAVASVLPPAGPDREAADTLEGPWDEAAANGTTGDLYFLKGDRMLEVGYLTSSTGSAGAVRLARVAVGRL